MSAYSIFVLEKDTMPASKPIDTFPCRRHKRLLLRSLVSARTASILDLVVAFERLGFWCLEHGRSVWLNHVLHLL